MVRVKFDDSEFSISDLDVEYEDNNYPDYEGEIPPNNTIVPGNIGKAWLTYTQDSTPMIKVLFTADETADEYWGLPIWDNLVFKPTAAFRYKPFLDAVGLTLKDVKQGIDADEEDDSIGTPIFKIGTWVPGSDESYLRVLTKRGSWHGVLRSEVKQYLPYEPEPEPEPEPVPARGRARRAAVTETVADDILNDDETEEDIIEDNEAPSRGRAAAGRRGKPAAQPAPAARRGKPAAKPAAKRGRGRAGDDVPF